MSIDAHAPPPVPSPDAFGTTPVAPSAALAVVDGGARSPVVAGSADLESGALDGSAVALAEDILNTHARSFRWASVLLPQQARREAAVVYAFCRLADDAVDEAETAELGRDALMHLLAELDGHEDARDIVVAFRHVMRVRNIPRRAVDELCAGILSDTDRVRMQDDGELLRYCYRVAGCVGLLMCGVIGVEDERAFPYALDLGIGMQLTNICRDVLEDLKMDRIYVPRSRLVAAGVDPDRLREQAERGEEPPGLRVVIRDLLDLAERYYASGNAGMHFIPLRARFSMMAAARIYRAIGLELRQRDCTAFEGRVSTSKVTKLVWLTRAVASAPFPSRGVPHEDELHRTLRGLPGTKAPADAQEIAGVDAPLALLQTGRTQLSSTPG